MPEHDQRYWKTKLLAYLHNLPDKCFNIAFHDDSALDFQLHAAFTDFSEVRKLSGTVKCADHFSSAADRFVFPKRKYSPSNDGQTGSSFIHPLSSIPFVLKDDVSHETEMLHQAFRDIVGAIDEDDWRKKFFLCWRRWLENAIMSNSETAKYLAFAPADSRIPDHTIWNHMTLTSACMACFDSDELKPAFLLFQLGNVQGFISQARSTRDLWSGSYLLSWLIAHALKTISDQVGPDAVIYPNLRNNGIFDLLHREEMYSGAVKQGTDSPLNLWKRMLDERGKHAAQWLLTPTLPNRFLALVPEQRAQDLAPEGGRSHSGRIEEHR